MKKKILITGGHAATAALATIYTLRKDKVRWEISWVGARRAMEGKSALTSEAKLFPKLVDNYFEIETGRLQRKWTRYTLPSLLKVPSGFFQSLKILKETKPEVVLSFGGFVGLPVVILAWFFRIPVVVHEQTAAAGLANKISAIFASKIAIARKSSFAYYNKNKTMLVGNPIQPDILKTKTKRKISARPVVFITGGSRGSQIINRVIFESVDRLLENYNIFHQTGDLDYKFSKSLNNENYKSFSFLSPADVAKVYKSADIVISRAGANTVSEVMYLRIPSILIPIPWTRYDEQTKNALLAEDAGVARVIFQDDLDKELLLKTLESVRKNWKSMHNAKKHSVSEKDKVASENLVKILRSLTR